MAPEDVTACEEKYNKSKMVHSIMRHVAETTGSDVNVRMPLANVCVCSPLHRLTHAQYHMGGRIAGIV